MLFFYFCENAALIKFVLSRSFSYVHFLAHTRTEFSLDENNNSYYHLLSVRERYVWREMVI